nr:hypothetical protein [Pseudomonas sp. BIGb0427]
MTKLAISGHFIAAHRRNNVLIFRTGVRWFVERNHATPSKIRFQAALLHDSKAGLTIKQSLPETPKAAPPLLES